MSNKVIYLKSLFRDFKPDNKVQKLINGAIKKSSFSEPEQRKGKLIDSRKFILSNAEDFLWYAVDYSINDKLNEGF